MIRISLSPEPQWFDLGHGVRLQLLPLTTALERDWFRRNHSLSF